MGLLDNHVPQQHYQNTHPGTGRYNKSIYNWICR